MTQTTLQARQRAGRMGRTMPRPPSDPDPDTYLGRVAMRLKKLREAARLEPEKAAERITANGYAVSESTIYRWEQGKTSPHVEALPAIASVYGVHVRTVLPAE